MFCTNSLYCTGWIRREIADKLNIKRHWNIYSVGKKKSFALDIAFNSAYYFFIEKKLSFIQAPCISNTCLSDAASA